MSDNGADDLFGDSDNEAPVVGTKADSDAAPLAKASSSRGTSPEPVTAAQSDAQVLPSEHGSVKGDMDDLFGDDDDKPQPDSQARTRTGTSVSTSRSGSPRRNNALEYEEEEGEAQEEQVQWANHVVPTWRRLGGTDGRVWHLKLPAYINHEAKPYDAGLYRAELDEEDVTGLAAKSRMIAVKNTLRWRWVKGEDGEYKKQSNARVLRWSDGTASLQLGADLFDIATSAGASLARPSDPVPDSKPSSSTLTSTPSASQAALSGGSGAVTYVCAAIGSAGVLMAEAPLAGQLSLVPTSMNSKTHMDLVRHVGQQHTKHSKLKILDQIGDPEKSGEGAMRFATTKTKRAPRRTGTGGGGGGGSGRKRGAKKWRGGKDSDEDDDERERVRPLGVDRGEYEDDGFVVDDDDEEDDANGGLRSSDEEEEYQSRRKSGRDRGAKSKKRKSTRGREYSDDDDDEDGELDPIELAEKELEDRERERKRAKRDAGVSKKKYKDKDKEQERKRKSREYVDTDEDEEEDGEGEEDMDVESEDD